MCTKTFVIRYYKNNSLTKPHCTGIKSDMMQKRAKCNNTVTRPYGSLTLIKNESTMWMIYLHCTWRAATVQETQFPGCLSIKPHSTLRRPLPTPRHQHQASFTGNTYNRINGYICTLEILIYWQGFTSSTFYIQYKHTNTNEYHQLFNTGTYCTHKRSESIQESICR